MAQRDEFRQFIRVAYRAFERIRAKTEQAVRKRIRERTGLEGQDADLLVEQIYRKIWGGILGFEFGRHSNTISWILTIVDHAITDYQRKGKRELPLPGNADDVADRRLSPAEDHERQRLFDLLYRAISKLGSQKRKEMAITIMFQESFHYDYADIARRLGLPSREAASQLWYNTADELRSILGGMGVSREKLQLIHL